VKRNRKASEDRRATGSVRLVFLNTAWQIGARVIGAVFGVVQAAILSHYLHSHGYGQYSFVLSVIGVCAVLTDMGLGLVTVRSLNQEDHAARQRTMGGMLVAKLLLSILAVAASDCFAAIAPIDTPERTGIFLMSALYVVSIPAAVSAAFQAELELHYPITIGTAQTALTVALTAVLVVVHAPLLALLGIQLATGALASIVLYQLASSRYGISFAGSRRLGMQIMRAAIPVGISQALIVLYFRIDAVLLGLLRGPVDVAHYAAAYRFVDLGNFGAAAFMGSMYPLMVRRGQGAGHNWLVIAYQRSTDLLMFVAVPLTVAWVVLARPIIFLIFPSDFEPAVGAVRVLSLVLVPIYMNNLVGHLVLTVHRERTFLWVSLGAAALNIGLNVVFIPAHGIMAAAVITVITELYVAVAGTIIVWQVLKFIPSPRSTLLILVATVLMAVPVYLLRDYLIVAAVTGSVVYALTTRLLGLWNWADMRTMLGAS
jgi:O-antigen/teichoic acid export membrane protein